MLLKKWKMSIISAIMNYINYLKHTLRTPETYYRRYDLDLAKVPQALSQAKRVALVALPFIALYSKPFGSAMSIGMGTIRAVSHLQLGLHHQTQGNWAQMSREVLEMAIAAFATYASIVSLGTGLAAITAIDTTKSFAQIVHFFWQGNYHQAGEEALQTLASSFYLAFMLKGSLELILISTLLQGAISFYQANQERKAGHYLEAGAKIALGLIRLSQVNQYRHQIQRRNAIFTIEKYRTLAEQAMKGRSVRHLIHHSLNDLDGKIDEKQVLLANQDEEYDFGSHFHGFGKGLVKGANLSFRKVEIDGEEKIECTFKVNHVHRSHLTKTLNSLTQLKQKEIQEILRLADSHATNIAIEKPPKDPSMWWFWIDDDYAFRSYKLKVEGLGHISIGGCKESVNLYDKVTIHMDRNKTLYDFHELLALTNLDAALAVSSQDDLERLKIGHLFRIFFPKEATPFEREEAFFTLSIEELKKKIIEKAPGMQELFNEHLNHMSQTELLPGRVRYQVDGLAEKVYKEGGRALCAAVTGAYNDNEELYKRVASMLNMGMISQELRDQYGISDSGYGGSYMTGGADSVYTQMITKQLIEEDPTLSSLSYQSPVRMLISLSALNSGTYQYFEDRWGTRSYGFSTSFFPNDLYTNRPDILELSKTLQNTHVQKYLKWTTWPYSGHEIMLKERLDPSFFQGIMVNKEETKQGLLSYLRTHHLVETVDGKEVILGKPVDEFIRVGQAATAALN